MTAKQITSDLMITVAHPVNDDFVVNWNQFLEDYEGYLDPSDPMISFTCSFEGATATPRKIAIDRLIRRLLNSFGIGRSDTLPGSFTMRNARWM